MDLPRTATDPLAHPLLAERILFPRRHDTLVGVDNAHRLHAWAAGPCRLKVFPQGDDNTLLWLNEAEYFDEIRAFAGSLDPPQRPGPAVHP